MMATTLMVNGDGDDTKEESNGADEDFVIVSQEHETDSGDGVDESDGDAYPELCVSNNPTLDKTRRVNLSRLVSLLPFKELRVRADEADRLCVYVSSV